MSLDFQETIVLHQLVSDHSRFEACETVEGDPEEVPFDEAERAASRPPALRQTRGKPRFRAIRRVLLKIHECIERLTPYVESYTRSLHDEDLSLVLLIQFYCFEST